MRHAILILAHDDFPALKKLIAYFCVDCDIYVHIDQKSKCEKDVLTDLAQMSGVRFISQKYRINWGSYNMLLAELYLLRIAFAEQRASYFHLFSGHDYPLRPLRYFLDFFEQNREMNYIHCIIANSKHIYDRLLQYHPYSWINAKKNNGEHTINRIVDLQR